MEVGYESLDLIGHFYNNSFVCYTMDSALQHEGNISYITKDLIGHFYNNSFVCYTMDSALQHEGIIAFL